MAARADILIMIASHEEDGSGTEEPGNRMIEHYQMCTRVVQRPDEECVITDGFPVCEPLGWNRFPCARCARLTVCIGGECDAAGELQSKDRGDCKPVRCEARASRLCNDTHFTAAPEERNSPRPRAYFDAGS